MDESFGLDRVEAARAELREEVEAALERGSKAQAFLELVEDVRGEGASKGGVVRVSVERRCCSRERRKAVLFA